MPLIVLCHGVVPHRAGNDGLAGGEEPESVGANGVVEVLNISQVSGSPENPGQLNVKRAADRRTDVFHAGSMLLHEGHKK